MPVWKKEEERKKEEEKERKKERKEERKKRKLWLSHTVHKTEMDHRDTVKV